MDKKLVALFVSIAALLFIVILIISIISITNSDGGVESLIGKWGLPSNKELGFEFRVNGTVIITDNDINTGRKTYTGTYAVNGKQISMDFGENAWTGVYTFKVSGGKLNLRDVASDPVRFSGWELVRIW